MNGEVTTNWCSLCSSFAIWGLELVTGDADSSGRELVNWDGQQEYRRCQGL